MPELDSKTTSVRRKVIAAVLSVLLLGILGVKMHKQVLEAGEDHDNDYECFVIGGRAVIEGEDIYAARTANKRMFCFPYWFGMFMVPFAAMSYTAAAIVWPLLNLSALAFSCYCCLKLVRGRGGATPWFAWIVPALLVVRPLDSNFSGGQVNVLILALTVGALYLHVKRRDMSAGLVLATATLMKVTPGLFVVYFAWKRRWRVVAGAGIGFVLLTLVVPIPLLGPRGGYDNFRRWIDERILVTVGDDTDSEEFREEREGYVPGQSVRAILFRFLTDSRAFSHTERDIRVNFADINPELVEWLFRGCAVLLVIILGWATSGRGSPGDVNRTAWEFSLVLIVMLLASPYSRKAHFVLLMLPMTFSWSAIGRLPRGSRERLVMVVATIACFVLTSLTADVPFGSVASEYLVGFTSLGWGTLALMVGLLATRQASCGDADPTAPPRT